jgi:hypothetical protein
VADSTTALSDFGITPPASCTGASVQFNISADSSCVFLQGISGLPGNNGTNCCNPPPQTGTITNSGRTITFANPTLEIEIWISC